MKCQHCNREVEQHDGQWIDPQATGDDAIWREVCDSHDTFTAEHQPNNDGSVCRHDANWVHHYDDQAILGDYYTCGKCGELTQVG